VANSNLTTEAPERSSHCKECGKKIKPENLYGYCVAHRRLSKTHESKHRASSDAWLERNRDWVNERERNRYASNPEKYRNKTKRQYAKNPEPGKQRSRDYRAKNLEEVNAKARVRTLQWAKDNPERVKRNSKVAKHKRRARELAAPGSFTAADIKEIFKAQGGRCAYCRKKLGIDHHADHIIALSKGGTNDRSNIQLTCEKCNLYKAAQDPIDFARLLGRLL
jgi:5-methylcytosine-specific restriction endonuclease McrA